MYLINRVEGRVKVGRRLLYSIFRGGWGLLYFSGCFCVVFLCKKCMKIVDLEGVFFVELPFSCQILPFGYNLYI